ncbi:hypothetical protein B9G98_03273 [Wickerhamiella sorbophila]|uniref:MICOS complex subunit MIC12 n=1 Tax=Wickerhamiella sorbophila TaxID=45607 RepID=A0A2T0FKY4_9ASCO|nr:hypothetical protein B9G98_03273 [Wickerhamiella sorbophila]PRT55653.1 hypothetical protein B9G98_03273 [Wickerhamiella sorbophila]
MARIYGLFGGIVTGLSVTYCTAVKIRKNTQDVCSELQLSQLLAENKPVITRPYTDPINLQTRSRKDIIVDLWDSEVIKAIQWVYSLGKA